MTLIISALNFRFVVQVSDRRLSKNDKPHAEYANKMVVFECREGIFAASYTGIANIGGEETDNWLFGILSANKVKTKNMGTSMEIIRWAASKRFEDLGMGKRNSEYLEFAIVGFHKKGKRCIPYYHEIQNKDEKGKVSSKFFSRYTRMKSSTRKNEGACLGVAGDGRGLDTDKLEELGKSLKTEKDGSLFVKELVNVIKDSADKTTTINKSCVGFLYTLNGNSVVEYFPETINELSYSYTPHILLTGIEAFKSKSFGPGMMTLPTAHGNLLIKTPKTGPGNVIYFGSKKDGPLKPT